MGEEPDYGFQLPLFMAATEQGKNHQAYVNPFLPPPIRNNLLRIIENREFMELDDLMPALPLSVTTHIHTIHTCH